MPGANLTFMTGSTNYCPSTLKDHAQTDGHKQAVAEEAHAEAEASGISLQGFCPSPSPHYNGGI